MRLVAGRLTFSLCILLALDAIGFAPVFVLLPEITAEGATAFQFHLDNYALILSGPLSAFWLLSTYDIITSNILIAIGLLSFIGWVFILLNYRFLKRLLAVPIVAWCIIGTFSTFFGLAAGV